MSFNIENADFWIGTSKREHVRPVSLSSRHDGHWQVTHHSNNVSRLPVKDSHFILTSSSCKQKVLSVVKTTRVKVRSWVGFNLSDHFLGWFCRCSGLRDGIAITLQVTLTSCTEDRARSRWLRLFVVGLRLAVLVLVHKSFLTSAAFPRDNSRSFVHPEVICLNTVINSVAACNHGVSIISDLDGVATNVGSINCANWATVPQVINLNRVVPSPRYNHVWLLFVELHTKYSVRVTRQLRQFLHLKRQRFCRLVVHLDFVIFTRYSEQSSICVEVHTVDVVIGIFNLLMQTFPTRCVPMSDRTISWPSHQDIGGL